MQIHSPPARFHLLDVARGLAAWFVVMSHYKHFYYVSPVTLPVGFEASRMPLYGALGPVYKYGGLSVLFFFTLSGFVFFSNYFSRIQAGTVDGRSFFWLRFSRLYPLHLATLLAVLALQPVYHHLNGQYFTYEHNDAFHFLLNLFLVSSWGIEEGWSFNGPHWSISLEALLYISFFVFSVAAAQLARREVIASVSLCIVVATALHFLIRPQQSFIFWGLISFYIGGLIHFAVPRIAHRRSSLVAAAIVAVASMALYTWFPRTTILVFVSFPAIIVALSVAQYRFADAGSSLGLLGDTSYTVYLVHFPVQLVIALAAGTSAATYDSPLMLAVFLAGVLLVSIPTHYLFELRSQKFVRAVFLRRPLAKAAPTN